MIRSGLCLATFLITASLAVDGVPMIAKAVSTMDPVPTVPESAPAVRPSAPGVEPSRAPDEASTNSTSAPAGFQLLPFFNVMLALDQSANVPNNAPEADQDAKAPVLIAVAGPAPLASNLIPIADLAPANLVQSPATDQIPAPPKQAPQPDPEIKQPKIAPKVDEAPKQQKPAPKAGQPTTPSVEVSVAPVPEPPHLNSIEVQSPFAEAVSSAFSDLHRRDHTFLTGEAEYILWFLKGPQSNTPIASSGVLGGAGSLVNSLGDNDTTKGPISGGRLTLAYWQYDDNAWAAQNSVRTFGVEARFFFVGNNSAEFTADAPAYLYRPFFDLNHHAESGFLVTAPGVANGSISARGQSSIWGAEANVWKNMYYDKPGTTYAIDFMAGLRYLNATSELEINSSSAYNATIPAPSPYTSFAGNRLQVSDSFTAHNQFYGGQIGIGMKSWLTDCLAFESSLRFAIGTTREDVTILGNQVRTLANGTTVTSNGGLLALPSNIGSHSNTAFSQVPEANFKALMPIGKQITLSAGFSALYWNRVARAPDQIDHQLDITQIPNFPVTKGTTPIATGSPGVSFPQSQLWLLGITLGVEYRW